MLDRYSRAPMAKIWSPEQCARIWWEIELHACQAQADLGMIPPDAADAMREHGWNYDPKRIEELERETHHELLAFLTAISEQIGPNARFIHQGLTSSDILDTTLAVQLNRASEILLADIDRLLSVLRQRAFEHKDSICIGRSHGIHAEPTSFGLKLAGHYAAFARNRSRLLSAQTSIATCALSGAVGNYATLSPEIEALVAQKLGLVPEPISTQVIPRDRHAYFFAVLAVIASSIENLAVEIRHLQRTEIREVEEYFALGQKGSSAMPHKRNPVLSENLTGLARLVRSYVAPALENVALWHERDISHSAVERAIAPDATIVLDFALDRLATVIEQLLIYPQRMRHNLEATGGLIFSQRVLLALTQAGLSRERAYQLVQSHAMAIWHQGGDFLSRLRSDSSITTYLSPAQLTDLLDLSYFLRYTDSIFARVFESDSHLSPAERLPDSESSLRITNPNAAPPPPNRPSD